MPIKRVGQALQPSAHGNESQTTTRQSLIKTCDVLNGFIEKEVDINSKMWNSKTADNKYKDESNRCHIQELPPKN